MKFPVRLALLGGAAALAVGATGCSAGSGGGGLLNYPGGTISLTDPTSGAAIVTSAAAPFIVPTLQLRFTINATETHYDGPYNVTIIAQENLPTSANGGTIYPFSFNEPCYTVSENDTFTQATVPIIFNGSNANGQPYAFPGGVVPTGDTGNPCHSGEFETALIADTKGHSVKFYYEEQ
jgi:hypothetical protein